MWLEGGGVGRHRGDGGSYRASGRTSAFALSKVGAVKSFEQWRDLP